MATRNVITVEEEHKTNESYIEIDENEEDEIRHEKKITNKYKYYKTIIYYMVVPILIVVDILQVIFNLHTGIHLPYIDIALIVLVLTNEIDYQLAKAHVEGVEEKIFNLFALVEFSYMDLLHMAGSVIYAALLMIEFRANFRNIKSKIGKLIDKTALKRNAMANKNKGPYDRERDGDELNEHRRLFKGVLKKMEFEATPSYMLIFFNWHIHKNECAYEIMSRKISVMAIIMAILFGVKFRMAAMVVCLLLIDIKDSFKKGWNVSYTVEMRNFIVLYLAITYYES